jgi:endonuclease/exonuclease/phosphatase family metal-dependent hydrolase
MPGTVSIRVASYNVHGCVGSDQRQDVPRIARVLRELRAEVVALQEVVFSHGASGEPEPVDLMAELAGFRAVCAPIYRDDGIHFGNAVLTSLPVESARTLSLSVDGFEPRTALDVRIDAHGRPLRVIATHLGLRAGERRLQVKRLLHELADDLPDTTLLMGDFNEWFLAGRPLRWLHARFGQGPARRSFPSRFPLLALDRIWAHPRQALGDFSAHRTETSRVASDHLRVVATLQLRTGQVAHEPEPAGPGTRVTEPRA